MTELKPCPFCEDEMEFEQDRWTRATTLEIRHKTLSSSLKVCHLKYQATYSNKDFDRFGDRFVRNFIDRWNRRVME